MKKIAIIGFGPRGLHALECFFKEYSKLQNEIPFEITIFEEKKELGSGNVWNQNQSDANWLNISERALENLEGRKRIKLANYEIPSFLSYKDWSVKNYGCKDFFLKDSFPPRSKMGKYLNERASSILNIVSNKQVKISKEKILNVDIDDDKIIITTINNLKYNFHEVLLAIGHQPTEKSEDILTLENEANSIDGTFLSKTYPIENIIDSNKIDNNTNVAIRGFGLAMIDAVRALTTKRGGKFTITNDFDLSCVFKTSAKVPKKIIPYSLDGLPMVPKPLNAKIDSFFTPSKNQLKSFEDELKSSIKSNSKTEILKKLLNLLAEIAANKYYNHPNKITINNISEEELIYISKKWLLDESYKHELIIDRDLSAINQLIRFTEMGTQKTTVSLDYCIGQIIRHCQPTMYKTLSHAKIADKNMSEIIEFDERMKRYSYGPPVESTQQLIALNNAGILELTFANNPKRFIKNNVWFFSKSDKKINIDVIINSVLDGPKLLKVKSKLVKDLLKNDILQPVHSNLGVETNKDGTVISKENDFIPISVIGRLAKGSVIGVDAILECFGPRVNDWAKGCVSRL